MNAHVDSPWFNATPIPERDDFLLGDVVVLRGQDQLMTVEDVCQCGSVDVVWFSGNENDGWTLHRDTFDDAMLINLDSDDE